MQWTVEVHAILLQQKLFPPRTAAGAILLQQKPQPADPGPTPAPSTN